MNKDIEALIERPNPGSKEAVSEGCTCPVIDNHYGRGIPAGKDGAPLFWQSENCPLHGVRSLNLRKAVLRRARMGEVKHTTTPKGRMDE